MYVSYIVNNAHLNLLEITSSDIMFLGVITMLLNLSNFQRGMFIAFIVFLTTLSNYFFNTGSFVASWFFITIGFALGFYLIFGNKVLPYIFAGILLSNILSRILFIDEDVLWRCE